MLSLHAGTTELACCTIQFERNGCTRAVASQFLKELRQKVKPVDMEYPRDINKANNGKRLENINRASRICTQMINVKKC